MNLVTTLKQKLNPILLEAFDIYSKKEVVESFINENDGSTLYSTLVRVELTSTFIDDLEKFLCYKLLGVDINSKNYKLITGPIIKTSYNYSIKSYFEDTTGEYTIYSGKNMLDDSNNISINPIMPDGELKASFIGKVGFINISEIKKDNINRLDYVDLCVNIDKPNFIYLQECTQII